MNPHLEAAPVVRRRCVLKWLSTPIFLRVHGAFASALAVRTIAGTGAPGFSGDGGPGEEAQINNPYGLTIGPDGALYFCEIGNHRIRRLDLKSGRISTFVGSGNKGYSGDGGPALDAALNEPYEVRFDQQGNLFFADMQNHAVRRVEATSGIISSVAGTGIPGFSGDGGPAAMAQLRQPHSIGFDAQGRLLICDIGNHRIRRVETAGGTIDTWAGTGERKPTPNGAPISGTPLNGPRAITADPQGNLYLVVREGNAVYRIDSMAGRIFHLAGTGESGYTGDGGDARQARLSGPKAIAWAPGPVLLLADTESHTIRRVDLRSGRIETAVGTGQRGDGPDGDPRRCRLARPHGVCVDEHGVTYIADSESHRLRVLR